MAGMLVDRLPLPNVGCSATGAMQFKAGWIDAPCPEENGAFLLPVRLGIT